MEGITNTPGFCPKCGSILPHLRLFGDIQCYTCKTSYSPEVFGSSITKFRVNFNSYEATPTVNIEDDGDDGPVLERTCPKCDNTTMSYATLQLRSADEGQTVFYTCTKCKHKETENS